MHRLILFLFCGLTLAVIWLHPDQSALLRDPRVNFRPLARAEGLSPAPGLVVEGAWQLRAHHEWFGGYSALVSDGDGLFTAVSDQGKKLDFTDPSLGPPRTLMSEMFPTLSGPKELRDAESMTRDPVTGRFWIGYEFRNAILRYDSDMDVNAGARPEAMRRWPHNEGPEALARLADGRFIVLSEGGTAPDGRRGAALLFPGDPAKGAWPMSFRLDLPWGYAPSDMTALPDGRVLIVARKLVFPFPPRFAVKLLLADPATIRSGQAWRWNELAELHSPVPIDNYEGITVVPGNDGSVMIWLISADNLMATQRTLLLKLRWDPTATAQR